jgi:AcrR family transcriptional regulator
LYEGVIGDRQPPGGASAAEAAVHSIGSRPPQTAPGRQRLSRDFVLLHQRSRLIDALAEEIVEKGYRDVTVADIVKRAGVARNTFYKNFANKEQCFLAAADVAGQEAMRRISAAVAEAGDSWAEKVRAAISEFLAFAAGESALTRVFIVDSLAAGPAAADRYERTVRAVVPLLALGRKCRPNGTFLPETLEETIVGGIFWIVYQRIVLDRPDELREALPELVEFALTPYLGAEHAKRVAEGEPC